jgi:cytochrome P450
MRNTKYFKNPDDFDIDRWSSEDIKDLNPYAYLPFSGGPRFCIG